MPKFRLPSEHSKSDICSDPTQHVVAGQTGGSYEDCHGSRRLRRISRVAAAIVLVAATLPIIGQPLKAQVVTDDQLADVLSAIEATKPNSFQSTMSALAPFAIVISAIGSWIFAFMAIQNNKSLAEKRSKFDREMIQRRETFDYMSKLRWDNDFIEASRAYIECTRQKIDFATLVDDYEKLGPNDSGLSDDDKSLIAKHSYIRRLLNEFEAIAVGIRTQALSEDVVKQSFGQAITSIVNRCEPFIIQTRAHAGQQGYTDTSNIYKECQAMVAAWSSGQTFAAQQNAV